MFVTFPSQPELADSWNGHRLVLFHFRQVIGEEFCLFHYV